MKENRTFYISVEGINCEKMYFNHLAKLINNSNRNKYNLSVDPKKTSPLKFAKRNAYKPVDTKGNTKLPFIHIQDIEDYYDNYQKGKFYAVIKEMRDAEEFINTSYKLGYSNYTFELWMLLHVADMRYAVADRSKYLEPINRWFHRKYDKIDEFKSETEFLKILDEYITLDSIFTAIERAEKIVEENKKKAASKEITFESYKGFDFYHDNPDLTVHTVVKLILDTCEVTVLPQSIIKAIEKCGFWESIPLWAVTLIGGLFITVLSFIMIMSVYGRFFKIYMYSAIAPIPLSTFAGEPTQNIGKTFLKSFCAVLLEGAIIVLACIIFSVFASSPPVVNSSASAVTQVWSYIGELIFNMLVLVGTVKMADRIVREMMGL